MGQRTFSVTRAMHVPGYVNGGADLLSRGERRPGNGACTLEEWHRSGTGSAGPRWIFLRLQKTHTDQSTPLGVDELSHIWPRTLLYAFLPVELIQPTLDRVCWVTDFDGSLLASEDMVHEHHDVAVRDRCLPLCRYLLSQGGILHPLPELWSLWAYQLRGRI